jgi:hypothetical protein
MENMKSGTLDYVIVSLAAMSLLTYLSRPFGNGR